jgi:hypothetical protein
MQKHIVPSLISGLFGFGGDGWKEEVLLHDGSKLIVERSQTRGGRHEIGQGSPISGYGISFVLPNTSQPIKWKAEFSADIGRADLHPLALHVLNATLYIITEPVGCLAYNKWGRPNPPYVIFKYDGKDWQHIMVQELPVEFNEMNLVNDTKGDADKLTSSSLVTADQVKKFNHDLHQAELKSIHHEPTKPHTSSSNVNCEEQVLYKGYWILPNDPVIRTIIDRRTK